ncbi:cellulose synthase [Leptolyngbya sp. Heron Island J]|uniref:cellulose biosynthesis cyclic di-GMP-binding regulatory protein BcsB n=1 Tax=Leptolyngbya sp. Heron Island J TaxID=1385935 RepID=UPI0003B9DD17|nr:cellulose biosynthesis cyclic di-GMP-binding regulatory protein BcsB [Leptolyngbya sp. Heron Island J]ESA32327.1 cellulose synthase [Leptolyngbya sp. Heron Island J]
MAQVTSSPGASDDPAEAGTAVDRRNRDVDGATVGRDLIQDAQAAELEQEDGSQYILEFNRSPVVGTRLRLEGIYNESRLRFTRPRNWSVKSVKILLRYRHSGALYATRSNLNVIVNDNNVGSVPLNLKQGDTGTIIFDIPTRILKDYNELVIAGLQNNSPTCTQDPFDPSLWTEILPDSKLVFNYEAEPFQLDFNSYPYPLIDVLSLETNHIDYIVPTEQDQTWLTSLARLQTSLGRIADYRPLETDLVKNLDDVADGNRVVVVGTPTEQPILANLDLPLTLKNDRWLDNKQTLISSDTGILMWTVLEDKQSPVLVATGNGPTAVTKAVQFLTQSQDRKIGAGQVVLVNDVEEIESPDIRDWPRYLPLNDNFELGDLTGFNNEPFDDVAIRGAHAPPFEFDFKALPDDRFLPGNTMTLRYTYGPQVNPLTSLVEVQLDGITVAGERLDSVDGQRRATLKVELPEQHITPQSRLKVYLRFDPRERRSCSRVTDHQLWGTIHSDSTFNLNRQQVAKLPDLNLLKAGYPFASPQDLSRTAIVVPDQPDLNELAVMLEFSERLGRLSRSEAVQVEVYPVSQLTPEIQESQHLVAIGLRSQFPLVEALEAAEFNLKDGGRQWGDSEVRTLPDSEGVLQQQLSPWNESRVLLTMTAQNDVGLQQLRDLLGLDSLFFQLQGDTALISANNETPSPYDENAYNLEFLQRSAQRDVQEEGAFQRAITVIQGNWFLLIPGIIVLSLLLYGVLQAYLKRNDALIAAPGVMTDPSAPGEL